MINIDTPGTAKIMSTFVNRIRSIALSNDGLERASLLLFWRIPVQSILDKDDGLSRLSHSAPPLDCLTSGPVGPVKRTR